MTAIVGDGKPVCIKEVAKLNKDATWEDDQGNLHLIDFSEVYCLVCDKTHSDL